MKIQINDKFWLLTEWPKTYFFWLEKKTLKISIPFTWNLPEVKEKIRQKSWAWDDVVVGGPAVFLMPGFFSQFEYVTEGKTESGVLQKINSYATRTSIGCPNHCAFCGVDKIESGGLVELADWPDLPIICDNNLLGCSPKHFDKVVDRLEKWGWADFQQGLDCRLLTPYHASRLKKIKKSLIRLALDNFSLRYQWEKAFDFLRHAGLPLNSIRSYALVGFNSDPADAWDRCEWIEKHKIKALPMWYHSLVAFKKNIVTNEQKELGWNDYERRRIMQWFYQHKKTGEK